MAPRPVAGLLFWRALAPSPTIHDNALARARPSSQMRRASASILRRLLLALSQKEFKKTWRAPACSALDPTLSRESSLPLPCTQPEQQQKKTSTQNKMLTRTRYCATEYWPNYRDLAGSVQTCPGKFAIPPSPEERGRGPSTGPGGQIGRRSKNAMWQWHLAEKYR